MSCKSSLGKCSSLSLDGEPTRGLERGDEPPNFDLDLFDLDLFDLDLFDLDLFDLDLFDLDLFDLDRRFDLDFAIYS